jgi:hypothetical protein
MDKLHKIKIDDIEDRDNILVIQVPETKTNKKRMFTIVANTKIVLVVSKLLLLLFFRIPPPPCGTAILPEYIHYYG